MSKQEMMFCPSQYLIDQKSMVLLGLISGDINHDLLVNMVSAMMLSDVLEVTKMFMRDPIQILVKKEELTLEGIHFNVE